MRAITSLLSIRNNQKPKYSIYLLVFLFTLHFTPSTYIDSSFLEQFVGGSNVGYVFSVASFITLIALIFIGKLLNRVGNYKTFLTFLIVDFISLFILSLSLFFSGQIWSYIFISSYVIGFIARSICFLNLDIFLEKVTENYETGGIRGFFLTFTNLAFIIGPLLAGLLIVEVFDLGRIYLLGWILLIPVIILTIKFFKNFQDTPYQKTKMLVSILAVYKNINLRNIFIANFILQLFYSWMIIYTPIFLSQVIGFSLGQTATIIGIALIAFVLLQLPLGKIADIYLGEKEIMTIGFVIASLATISMSFFGIESFYFWAGLLFMTRVGASMIEIMTETHLFKRINDDSVNVIGLFRAIRPVGYIVGPIIASVLLLFIELEFIFLILGAVLMLGISFSLNFEDSK